MIIEKIKSHIPGSKIKKTDHFHIFCFHPLSRYALSAFFAIINARKQMLSHYETQLETEAIRIKSTLFDITTSVRTNTQSIIENQSFRNLFNTSYSDDTKAAYDLINSQLETYYSTSAAIKSTNVYTDNLTFHPMGIYTAFRMDLPKSPGICICPPTHTPHGQVHHMWIVSEIHSMNLL